jgi:hypothetical protein
MWECRLFLYLDIFERLSFVKVVTTCLSRKWWAVSWLPDNIGFSLEEALCWMCTWYCEILLDPGFTSNNLASVKRQEFHTRLSTKIYITQNWKPFSTLKTEAVIFWKSQYLPTKGQGVILKERVRLEIIKNWQAASFPTFLQAVAPSAD